MSVKVFFVFFFFCGKAEDIAYAHLGRTSSSVTLGQGHTKATGNRNATTISEKNRLFQAGNWFPD
jgi:hypothetical protein